MDDLPKQDGAVVVYDGECPFCSRYVEMLRLRDSLGSVKLMNAREGGPLVDALRQRGIDLDEGMVFVLDGEVHHGAESVHMMALLSTPIGVFNRLNGAIFRSRRASRLLYPVLRAGRNTVLALLGRERLGNGGA